MGNSGTFVFAYLPCNFIEMQALPGGIFINAMPDR